MECVVSAIFRTKIFPSRKTIVLSRRRMKFWFLRFIGIEYLYVDLQLFRRLSKRANNYFLSLFLTKTSTGHYYYCIHRSRVNDFQRSCDFCLQFFKLRRLSLMFAYNEPRVVIKIHLCSKKDGNF
jgi:hypothetical protein